MKMSEMKDAFGSDNSKWLKLKDGANKLRIVSEVMPLWKAFDVATKSARTYLTEKVAKADKDARKRFVMYVLNRDAGGALQIAEFGPSVMKQVYDLSLTDEYKFDNLPPYDMTISKSGSGMETEYTVIAARANTALTAEETALVDGAESLFKIFAKDAEDASDAIPF